MNLSDSKYAEVVKNVCLRHTTLITYAGEGSWLRGAQAGLFEPVMTMKEVVCFRSGHPLPTMSDVRNYMTLIDDVEYMTPSGLIALEVGIAIGVIE